jgi:hypothetical protein
MQTSLALLCQIQPPVNGLTPRPSPSRRLILTATWAATPCGRSPIGDWTSSTFRQFPVTKKTQLERRGEAFNLFNTVVYGTPDASITDKIGFGAVT